VTTIVGLTERTRAGRLHNTAAIVHRGSVIGTYRKLYPAIHRSVYTPGDRTPVFQIAGLTFGIVICNDSNYAAPIGAMAARGATALFVPTNNGLPPRRRDPELVRRTREIDRDHAVRHHIWVIRADVAGQAGELSCEGSSAIVDPTGVVRQSAARGAEDLLVAEL
jgi:predicted amidohydrolase